MKELGGSLTEEVKELIRILSSPAYMQIIALLAKGELYTREIARILGRDETDVSRRLRRLEELGIVSGVWKRIADRNVRVYKLKVRNLKIEFTPEGPRIEFEGASEAGKIILRLGAPDYPEPIGRTMELNALADNENASLILIRGPAGAGKTHLAAYHLSKTGRPVVWIRLSPGENLRTVSRRIGLFLLERGHAVDLAGFNAFASRDYVAKALSRESAVVVFDDVHQAEYLGREVLSLVKWLAGQAFSHQYQLVLIGRNMPRGIAFWREKSLDLYVSEVAPEDYAAIANMYSRRAIASDQVDEKVRERIPLIPLTARQLGFIYDKLGDLDRALDALDKAYYKGYLSEIAGGEAEYRIIKLLAVAGRPVPWELPCRLTGIEAGPCRAMLNRLWNHALIEYVDYEVKLHDFYMGLRRTIDSKEAATYRSLIGKTLVRSPSYDDKLHGFRYLAEACDLRSLVEIVEARLERGLRWPFHNPSLYIEALNIAIKCSSDPAFRLLLSVEHQLFSHSLRNPVALARALKELEAHYSISAPRKRDLRARLLALSACYFIGAGERDEALYMIRRALDIVSSSGTLLTSTLTSIYSTGIEVYIENDMANEAMDLADRFATIEFEDIAEYLRARTVKAMLLRRTGMADVARRELEKLSTSVEELPGYEYKPVYYKIREELFHALIDEGDPERALDVALYSTRVAERAAKTIPQYEERVKRHIAEQAIALAALGRHDEARKLFPLEMCRGEGTTKPWRVKCRLFGEFMGWN